MTRDERRRTGPLPILLGVSALLLLPLAPAQAGEKDEAGHDGEGRQVTFAGTTMSIDPETGHLRPPSAEEVKKLRAGMRELFARMRAERRSQGATIPEEGMLVPREDGVTSALVGTKHLNFTVARVGPDGRASTRCVNGDQDGADHPEPTSTGE
jgi:hypothetical protein